MRLSKSRVVLAGLIVVSCLAGCSKPAVRTTSIDGRFAEIKNFRIEWDGEAAADSLIKLQGGEIEKHQSKYTVAEHCLDYVKEVGQILAVKHGFGFYDNMPVEGVIRIKLYGQKITSFAFEDSDAEGKFGELSAPDFVETSPFPEDSQQRRAYFRAPWVKDDRVDGVRVTIVDNTGKLLGEILIGDNEGGHFSPGKTAQAIADARLGK